MNRTEFHKLFKCIGPAVLPVIHVLDNQQTERNVRIAVEEGAQGVFLINHDFDYEQMLPIIAHVRQRFPHLWLGVNFLAVTGKDAFPVLAQLAEQGIVVDAYWGDDARIDEKSDSEQQTEAAEIAQIKAEGGWNGLYFGGTAFKKQRPVASADYAQAATLASQYMDVVTTSGIATGEAADSDKIDQFRSGCGDGVLALASGVTPANAHLYGDKVDAFLVATGINKASDFYNIDAAKLRKLLTISRQSSGSERWYLRNMAPNLKGDKFAWLDPSAMYINARSFHALIDDLSQSFVGGEVDVVAGIDAMGFVLGSALATKLGKGFLPVRKAGKIPVETDSVSFVNYSKREQQMELRKPAFALGTRVLLVDQWIETGGTMQAAIDLVERQQGVVAGIATVCIEENPATQRLREKYYCVTAVLPHSTVQAQCNQQTLASFADFSPERVFPDI